MSKRDNGVSRRLRWGAGVAAVLVLGTGTAAAHAVWESRVALPAETVSSGSLALSAEWGDDWSAWSDLQPGTFVDTAPLVVKEEGAGTTLRWRLKADVVVDSRFRDYVSAQVFVGACGGANVVPSGGSYAPPGGYPSGQTVSLCVRLVLRTDAPSNLQGKPVLPEVIVEAEQVMS